MKVTLVLPVLNEIDGLKATVPHVKKEWVDQIIVLDGGSTDGSILYCRENGYTVHEAKTRGLGNQYREILPLIQGEYLIVFSPDGNSDPARIPALARKLSEGHDMVIVSRYLEWAKSEDDDPITAFGNWMFTALINLFFGGRLTDSLVIFRGYRKSLLADLKLSPRTETWEPQLDIQCLKGRLRVAEIPGNEPRRIGGQRKMKPLKNGTLVLWIILKEFFQRG